MELKSLKPHSLCTCHVSLEGTDIDGFRVDTPMQVPLNFYKTWCPAMREHAATVGKQRFGIFGEFFVSVQRSLGQA